PSREERARVRHHLIDVVEPGERYDVYRYQRDARAALDDVRGRGRVAILVGGTGLYVRAVLDGLDLAALPHDAALRSRLESEPPEAVHARLRELDPESAARVDPRNVRRLVRYLEAATLARGPVRRRRTGPRVPALRIGLRPPREALVGAIERRVRDMVTSGVLDETRALDELGALVEAASGVVVGKSLQQRRSPDPHWWVGKGKAEEIGRETKRLGADIVVADDELSPSQQRALEDATGVAVIDRSTVILDIFARHARSREGKIQVELAQLEYRLPRLTGRGKEMSRLGGGIGTRGPGESKLESGRQISRKRIQELR